MKKPINKPTKLPSIVKKSKALTYLGLTPLQFKIACSENNVYPVKHKGEWRYRKMDILSMKGK